MEQSSAVDKTQQPSAVTPQQTSAVDTPQQLVALTPQQTSAVNTPQQMSAVDTHQQPSAVMPHQPSTVTLQQSSAVTPQQPSAVTSQQSSPINNQSPQSQQQPQQPSAVDMPQQPSAVDMPQQPSAVDMPQQPSAMAPQQLSAVIPQQMSAVTPQQTSAVMPQQLSAVNSLTQASEIVYPEATLKGLLKDTELSTTVPSISDSISPSVLPTQSSFGAISRTYAPATSYSFSELESDKQGEALPQEAETSQKLVLVCVLISMTVFVCITQTSLYCASFIQTAPQGILMEEGELVLDLDVSKDDNPSEHDTTTADSEKALLV